MFERDQKGSGESPYEQLSLTLERIPARHLSRCDRPVVSARPISPPSVFAVLLEGAAKLCQELSVLYRKGKLGTDGQSVCDWRTRRETARSSHPLEPGMQVTTKPFAVVRLALVSRDHWPG
jgi:hypothetical protein